MGIPKFYRWIRIPEFGKMGHTGVPNSMVPDNGAICRCCCIDHFYLDMNGIVHKCSHPDDSKLSHLSEAEIFNSIFEYIEYLFQLIRPKRVFFLALDGVAPRAKMNQQRSRRFRTAQETKDKFDEAVRKGLLEPKEPPFDSNCITPGTAFMAKLTVHMKYFLSKKVSEDPSWRQAQIIFSGHEVPGEGEHKIMEYIRSIKASGASSSSYFANMRHCIYGLDADLIMLGLLSHEPHTCLLREQITFGRPASSKSKARPNAADQKDASVDPFPKFDLLHLCLLREYLDLEFKGLFSPETGIVYSLERVIDDFILLSILIGNDFVPHLPTLHIHTNAYNVLFDAYKASLPLMKGYLNDNGKIQFGRFAIFLQQLCRYELDVFLESESHAQASSGREREITKQMVFEHDDNGDSDNETAASSSDVSGPLSVSSETLERALDLYEASLAAHIKVLSLASPSDPQLSALASNFADMKRTYYGEKLGFDPIKWPESLDRMCYHYFTTCQWIMFYYYQGVPSWSYFYPFHYAPRMSDLAAYLSRPSGARGFGRRIESDLRSTKTTPFRPYEQLMAVLPPGSARLVPAAYRDLMSDASSPIIDFYPTTFLKDMNGKKNDWEAIVCIPFIEEARLLGAMRARNRLLSEDEQRRNEFGPSLVFRYSKDMAAAGDMRYPPPSLAFQPICPCSCEIEIYDLPVLSLGTPFVPDLCPGANVGAEMLPGFPTLATLAFVAGLERIGIRVFPSNPPSENLSMVLRLLPSPDTAHAGHLASSSEEDLRPSGPVGAALSESCVAEIAAKAIAQVVYVEWPFRREAIVHAISDGRALYEALMFPSLPSNPEHLISKSSIFYKGPTGPMSLAKRALGEEDRDAFERSALYMQDVFERRNGIRTGPIEILVSVLLLEGLREADDGSLVKCYSSAKLASRVPYQLCNFATTADARWLERAAPSLPELWPKASIAIYVGSDATAAMGPSRLVRVLDVIEASGLVEIEPVALDVSLGAHGLLSLPPLLQHSDYLSSGEVASLLNVSSLLLSKLTSTYHIYSDTRDSQKMNIGLELKFEKQALKVLGYTERDPVRGYWLYSRLAIELLQEYKSRFEKLFFRLEGCLRLAQTSSLTSASKIMMSQLFDTAEEQGLLRLWLSSKPELTTLRRVPVHDVTLSSTKIKECQALVDNHIKAPLAVPLPWAKLRVKSSCENILSPCRLARSISLSSAPSAEPARLQVGARVIFGADPALAIGMIRLPPLGSLGTVVGLASSHGLADVLLDVLFCGASDLGQRCADRRGMTVPEVVLVPLLQSRPAMEGIKPTMAAAAAASTRLSLSPNKAPLPNPWAQPARPSYSQVAPPASYQSTRKTGRQSPVPPARASPQKSGHNLLELLKQAAPHAKAVTANEPVPMAGLEAKIQASSGAALPLALADPAVMVAKTASTLAASKPQAPLHKKQDLSRPTAALDTRMPGPVETLPPCRTTATAVAAPKPLLRGFVPNQALVRRTLMPRTTNEPAPLAPP